jgi:hypothetical protein
MAPARALTESAQNSIVLSARMIPKSGHRFSVKIMRKRVSMNGLTTICGIISREIIS